MLAQIPVCKAVLQLHSLALSLPPPPLHLSPSLCVSSLSWQNIVTQKEYFSTQCAKQSCVCLPLCSPPPHHPPPPCSALSNPSVSSFSPSLIQSHKYSTHPCSIFLLPFSVTWLRDRPDELDQSQKWQPPLSCCPRRHYVMLVPQNLASLKGFTS